MSKNLIKFMKTSPKNNKFPVLSVVILNYNSGEYLKNCLQSLYQSTLSAQNFEIVVVDNSSTDKSIGIAKKIPSLSTKYLILDTNNGFSHGNNRGVEVTNPSSKYILFLNPDTIVEKYTLKKMIEFFETNQQVSAATCKIILAKTNQIQSECHRDFPTPLNAFLHFSRISSRQYFMEYLDYSKTQKINACVGAFFMIKREVGNTIGWWNEKYFMYGEDLDFCFKLKQKKYNLFYYPETYITHYQGISSGIGHQNKKLSQASRQTKIRSALATTNAMRIFYKENLFSNYSWPIRLIVLGGIKLLEIFRVFKAKYL